MVNTPYTETVIKFLSQRLSVEERQLDLNSQALVLSVAYVII